MIVNLSIAVLFIFMIGFMYKVISRERDYGEDNAGDIVGWEVHSSTKVE